MIGCEFLQNKLLVSLSIMIDPLATIYLPTSSVQAMFNSSKILRREKNMDNENNFLYISL